MPPSCHLLDKCITPTHLRDRVPKAEKAQETLRCNDLLSYILFINRDENRAVSSDASADFLRP